MSHERPNSILCYNLDMDETSFENHISYQTHTPNISMLGRGVLTARLHIIYIEFTKIRFKNRVINM